MNSSPLAQLGESLQCRLCAREKDKSELLHIEENDSDKLLLKEILGIELPEKTIAKYFCVECRNKLRILGMHQQSPCIKSKRLKAYEDFKKEAIETAKYYKKLDDSRMLSEKLAEMKRKRLSEEARKAQASITPKRIKIQLR